MSAANVITIITRLTPIHAQEEPALRQLALAPIARRKPGVKAAVPMRCQLRDQVANSNAMIISVEMP
ncbi:MAG: hypothetical protein DCC75_06710 [Proteobacteria bacterium]|nr:MAG: hypothetical protein DCC75_06710 [Pseudomonadota bacterium]